MPQERKRNASESDDPSQIPDGSSERRIMSGAEQGAAFQPMAGESSHISKAQKHTEGGEAGGSSSKPTQPENFEQLFLPDLITPEQLSRPLGPQIAAKLELFKDSGIALFKLNNIEASCLPMLEVSKMLSPDDLTIKNNADIVREYVDRRDPEQPPTKKALEAISAIEDYARKINKEDKESLKGLCLEFDRLNTLYDKHKAANANWNPW